MEVANYKCPIAHPYADDVEKLTPKIYSLIRKCDASIKIDAKNPYRKRGVQKGIKEIAKALLAVKKGGKDAQRMEGALIVLGGDVSPCDVVSHIPKLAEDAGVPYIWVPSRKDLGLAAGSRRPASIVLLEAREEYAGSLSKCIRAANKLRLAE